MHCCYICDKRSIIATVRLYCKHSHVGTWRRRPWGIVSWPRILLTATVSLFSFPNFRKLVTSSTNGRWPISCSITFFPFTHCNRIHSVFLFFIGTVYILTLLFQKIVWNFILRQNFWNTKINNLNQSLEKNSHRSLFRRTQIINNNTPKPEKTTLNLNLIYNPNNYIFHCSITNCSLQQ